MVWASGRSLPVVWLAVGALTLGFLVSYARARAEAVGWDASVGLFERTDRLVVALLALLAAGLGVGAPALVAGLAVVCLGSAVTVVQRVVAAMRAAAPPPTPGRPGP